MEKETIFDFLLLIMRDAEAILDLDGKQKKEYAMQALKEHLEGDIYERYSPILDLTIDGIIYLAKNKKILNELITKSNCRCF